jgi:hypothetical protein
MADEMWEPIPRFSNEQSPIFDLEESDRDFRRLGIWISAIWVFCGYLME